MLKLFLLPLLFIFGCAEVNLISTGRDIGKVALDLPRHNNLVYVNRNSINEDFFQAVENTLDNGFVYIILSSTGSPAANLISTFTGQEYAHTSLAFDEDLKTIVSYNGGNGISEPGMNQEIVEYFHQKEDANLIVYRLQATRREKKIILNEVKKINETGSSYNILGLFLPFKIRENTMYCSQFVYTMLQAAGLDYFEIQPGKVQPIDFVEKDQQGKLEFCRKIVLKDLAEEN
ncbi:MAG: hypothetical protein Q7J16_03515 [Candidatus Cloacimonadales bacterium]|nr:hypothetical protein [Candidatus Cloacimonadales bacterium]